jgi:hypothetical protein
MVVMVMAMAMLPSMAVYNSFGFSSKSCGKICGSFLL